MPASEIARQSILLYALCVFGCTPAYAQRTPLKPGWNMFSPQQDMQVGKQAATDAARKLPMCNSPQADAYLTQLGKRLVAHAFARLAQAGVPRCNIFVCNDNVEGNRFWLGSGWSDPTTWRVLQKRVEGSGGVS